MASYLRRVPAAATAAMAAVAERLQQLQQCRQLQQRHQLQQLLQPPPPPLQQQQLQEPVAEPLRRPAGVPQRPLQRPLRRPLQGLRAILRQATQRRGGSPLQRLQPPQPAAAGGVPAGGSRARQQRARLGDRRGSRNLPAARSVRRGNGAEGGGVAVRVRGEEAR
jgi:hypothetical protein